MIEIIAAIIGLIYLYFEYHANAWMWVFGLIMQALYIYLFYVNGVFANAAINLLYGVMSIYGLLEWKGLLHRDAHREEKRIESMPQKLWWVVIAIVALLTIPVALLLGNLEESQVPWLDSLSTTLSIAATWMLIHKYYQEWILWMIVEPLMIAVGILTGMYATALLYAVNLVVVLLGYRKWKKLYENQKTTQSHLSNY